MNHRKESRGLTQRQNIRKTCADAGSLTLEPYFQARRRGYYRRLLIRIEGCTIILRSKFNI